MSRHCRHPRSNCIFVFVTRVFVERFHKPNNMSLPALPVCPEHGPKRKCNYQGRCYWRCYECYRQNAIMRRRKNGTPAFGSVEYKRRCAALARKRFTTHGFGAVERRTPAYRSWLSMRNRCNNSKTRDYRYYGAKGIKVCVRWNSFLMFLADMGNPPPGRTLDRKNRNGNYSPTNCRWATRKLQARNRGYCKLSEQVAKVVRLLYSKGEIFQYELAERFGVSQSSISQIVRGLSWT